MKRNLFKTCGVLIVLAIALAGQYAHGQNGLIGDGFGTNNWSTIDNFIGSVGSSRIGTFTANSTGDRYFRLVTNWDYNNNQWGPSSTSNNYAVTVGSEVPASEIIENRTSTAYYINVSITDDKYVFKTKAGGNPPSSKGLIVFRIQGGTVQTVNAVSTPGSTIYPGQDYTVTATTSGTSTGQGVYLRYTNDGFSTSTVVAMTGSGTTYSAVIPAATNISGKTVTYYVFTSGNGLTISAANADWYTINLKGNYSYAVSSSTDYYITKADGNWNTGATWTGDNVPVDNKPIIIAHNVTLDKNATVSSLAINSGKTFTASDNTARTLTIAKSTSGTSTTLSNSGTWANGTGGSTVVFTGAPSSGDAVHAVSGTIAFQNITVNKTGGSSNVGASFGAGSTVSGTLEIGSGGFISTAPPSGFYGASAILKFNQGTGANYDVYDGDYSWSKTVIPNYITISSGTVNLKADRTATGDLLIDGGTLKLDGGNLTIQGNWTRTSGTFDPNSKMVTLSGNTNTAISTDTDATLDYLTVSKTSPGTVTLNSNMTVDNDMTISSGAFIVSPSKSLTVTGTLKNDAGSTGLVVKSGGSLITKGTITGTGTATVEREIANDFKWHFLSSPVTSQAILGSFAPSTWSSTGPWLWDFYYWNPNIADVVGNLPWVNLRKLNGTINDGTIDANNNNAGFGSAAPTMTVGRGYMAGYDLKWNGSDPAPTLHSFTGALNTGSVSIPVNADYNKSNLIGNPYPSAIDWKASSGWTHQDYLSAYGSNDYWIWNEAAGGYGAYSSSSNTGTRSTTQYIAPCQAFFVYANTTGNVVLNDNARVHNSQFWLKSTKAEPNNLRLKITTDKNTYYDEMVVSFGQEFPDSDHGTMKFYSMLSETPEIWSVKNSENYCIDRYQEGKQDVTVNLAAKAGVEGSYTLAATNIADFNLYREVTLQDLKTGTVQDLRSNPEYTFTGSPSDNVNRFKLFFGISTTAVGNSKAAGSEFSIYSRGSNIAVAALKPFAGTPQATVFNTLGQQLYSGTVGFESPGILKTGNLPPGAYIVSIRTQSGVTTAKVIIR